MIIMIMFIIIIAKIYCLDPHIVPILIGNMNYRINT